MKFLPYQRSWIDDTARMRLMVKSRRIGGTLSTSYDAFMSVMKNEGHDVVIITRDMITAIQFVGYVKSWGKIWNSTNSPSKQLPDTCFRAGSLTIPHRGGESKLMALSSNPDAAAGKGGDLIIDEMALHKDQQLLVTVAKPVVTAGGRLTILSTHRSKSSLFNRYVMDAQISGSSWSLHRTTIVDACDQGFVDLVVNPKRKQLGYDPMTKEEYLHDLRYNVIADDAIWDQEYMCIPSEQQYTLIPWDLVLRAARPFEDKEGPCFLGWDIAESEDGDYSVMFVLRRIGDRLFTVYHKYTKGIDLPTQREEARRLISRFRIRKMCLDATGLGTDSAQTLAREFGEHMVEGVKFTMQSKEEMASRMLDMFQSDSILIPNDEKVMKDVNMVEKIYTAAGNVTYRAPHEHGQHADGFWAMALAARAAGWKRSSKIELVQPAREIRPAEWITDVREWERQMDTRVPNVLEGY